MAPVTSQYPGGSIFPRQSWDASRSNKKASEAHCRLLVYSIRRSRSNVLYSEYSDGMDSRRPTPAHSLSSSHATQPASQREKKSKELDTQQKHLCEITYCRRPDIQDQIDAPERQSPALSRMVALTARSQSAAGHPVTSRIPPDFFPSFESSLQDISRFFPAGLCCLLYLLLLAGL